MSYTQSDIDALEAAMKLGQSRVRLGESDVTFRDLNDMQALLREMKRQVAGTAAAAPGARHQLADFGG